MLNERIIKIGGIIIASIFSIFGSIYYLSELVKNLGVIMVGFIVMGIWLGAVTILIILVFKEIDKIKRLGYLRK